MPDRLSRILTEKEFGDICDQYFTGFSGFSEKAVAHYYKDSYITNGISRMSIPYDDQVSKDYDSFVDALRMAEKVKLIQEAIDV